MKEVNSRTRPSPSFPLSHCPELGRRLIYSHLNINPARNNTVNVCHLHRASGGKERLDTVELGAMVQGDATGLVAQAVLDTGLEMLPLQQADLEQHIRGNSRVRWGGGGILESVL